MLLQMMRLNIATARMMTEAQTVIGLRMLGMAGMVPSATDETPRMVTEKQTAFAKAGLAAATAVMTGRGPLAAYGSALGPIGRTTRSNVRRLSKRT